VCHCQKPSTSAASTFSDPAVERRTRRRFYCSHWLLPDNAEGATLNPMRTLPISIAAAAVLLAALLYFLARAPNSTESVVPASAVAQDNAIIPSTASVSTNTPAIRGIVVDTKGSALAGSEITYRFAGNVPDAACQINSLTAANNVNGAIAVTHSDIKGSFSIPASISTNAKATCLLLQVTLPGYATVETALDSNALSRVVEIELERQFLLSGVVSDPYGTPAPSASVNAWIAPDGDNIVCSRIDYRSLSTGKTSSQGRFSIDVNGENNYCLQATHARWASSEPTALLASEPRDDIRLKLTTTLQVTGQVREQQQPASNLPIKLSKQIAFGHLKAYQAKTDGDGRFVFVGVEAGEYTLTSENAAYAIAEPKMVTVQANTPIENLAVSAYPLTAIRGRVVDSAGLPISGAHITARSPYAPEINIGSAISDSSGAFTLQSGHRAEEIVTAQRMRAGETPVGRANMNSNAVADAVSQATVCVDFYHPRYRADERTIAASSATTDMGTVFMQAPTLSLQGNVTNHRSEPVAATLTFKKVVTNAAQSLDAAPSCNESFADRQTSADIQGRFAVHLDAPGQYEVTVLTQLYQPRVIMVDVATSNDVLDIKLK
jgi:hypothetical protein